MFDSLTKEMFIYSVIPVAIVAIITLVILILGSKKERKDRERFNYMFNVLLLIAVSIILPFIIGYTIWMITRFTARGILFSNLGFIIVLALFIITLSILFIIITKKLYEHFNDKKDSKKL